MLTIRSLLGLGVLFTGLALAPAASAALPTTVYTNDFESGALGAEWSLSGTCDDVGCIGAVTGSCTSTVFCLDASGGSNNFLGRMDPGTATLTLSGLAPHTELQVDLDLFIIASWDGLNCCGPDDVRVIIDGATVLDCYFAIAGGGQDFPACNGVNQGEYAGAFERNRLGDCCTFSWGNAAYTFPSDRYPAVAETQSHGHVLKVPHTASTATIQFVNAATQTCTDECMGIDNVVVTTDHAPVPVPELGTLALLAAGLVGIGALVTVRRRVP